MCSLFDTQSNLRKLKKRRDESIFTWTTYLDFKRITDHYELIMKKEADNQFQILTLISYIRKGGIKTHPSSFE